MTTYIFRQLCLTNVCAAVILTFAVWLTQSLRFVDIVINKGFPLTTFFYFIFFLVPDFVAIVLPVSLLIAVLFVYRRLIVDSELIIMRASGISDWQLAKPCLVLGLFITVVLYILSLHVLPRAFQRFKDMEYELQNTLSLAMVQEGEFTTIKGVTLFVRERQNRNNVKGLILHDVRNPDRPFTIIAERASLIDTLEGSRLVLAKGIRQEINRTSRRPSMLYFDHYVLDLKQNTEAGVQRHRKPYELAIEDLFSSYRRTSIPKAERQRLWIEAQQRLLGPLLALLFAAVGAVGILIGDFNRREISKRLVGIVAVCCVVQVLITSLIHLGERLPFAYLFAYGIVFILLGGAFYCLCTSAQAWRLTSLIGRRKL